jgi:hypothetical protein
MVPDDFCIFLLKLIVEAIDFVNLLRRNITLVHCVELTLTRLVVVPVPDRPRTRMQRPGIFGISDLGNPSTVLVQKVHVEATKPPQSRNRKEARRAARRRSVGHCQNHHVRPGADSSALPAEP